MVGSVGRTLKWSLSSLCTGFRYSQSVSLVFVIHWLPVQSVSQSVSLVFVIHWLPVQSVSQSCLRYTLAFGTVSQSVLSSSYTGFRYSQSVSQSVSQSCLRYTLAFGTISQSVSQSVSQSCLRYTLASGTVSQSVLSSLCTGFRYRQSVMGEQLCYG